MRNTIDASKLDLKETIVNIRRVAKTVKGGRNFRFSAVVVVGDENGHILFRPGRKPSRIRNDRLFLV